jgi:hypothetical protein
MNFHIGVCSMSLQDEGQQGSMHDEAQGSIHDSCGTDIHGDVLVCDEDDRDSDTMTKRRITPTRVMGRPPDVS